MVKQGAPLFVIDTRSLDSAIAEAQSGVLEAEAALQRARQDVERYKPLLPDDAIPRQVYEQAVSAEKQAQSVVESRREAVNRARIDRSFAEVRAPVTGQIGLQKVEVGGLATAGQTVLATVSTLDPMLVYVSIAESDYIAYTRRYQTASRSGRVPAQPVQLSWPTVRSMACRASSTSPTAPSTRPPARSLCVRWCPTPTTCCARA